MIDIRGGKKLDKVTLCHKPDRPFQTIVVNSGDVAMHLAHGDYLGACTSAARESIVEQDNTLPKPNMVKLYPNPSNHSFTIVASGNTTLTQLVVTDMQGRIIDRKYNVGRNGTFQFGGNYIPGMYLVSVMQDGKIVQRKIIKSGNP